MRHLAVLVATAILAACSTVPHTHDESPTVNHTHGPSVVRFRDVRIGHIVTPGGKDLYLLCGQFLPAQAGGKAEWTPFATIKTSGYEQWIGAVGLCQDSSVIWNKNGDLSSSLQNRLDSLR